MLALRSRLSARERRLLFALLLGAVLIRLAVIWMPSDQMFEHGNLPFEEVLRGNAARDFQDGTLLPLLDYQLNHFSGGSLVVSILAVPFFIVGGPLFPVLRLVSLCFSITLVLLTFDLVDRWKGRRAAWTAAALIAFAPPGYQFLNCTVYGTHLEGNLVTIALTFAYFKWRESQRERSGTLCLGLASGLAVWFGYGQCVVLGVLFLVETASTGLRAVLGRAPAFALGFVLGLGLWIANTLRDPGAMLNIYERSIVTHFGPSAYTDDKLAVLGNLFVYEGPRAFWFHDADPSVGVLTAHAFFWGAVLLFGSCLWLERRSFAALCRALVGREAHFAVSLRFISVLFISSWLFIFGLSDFRVESENWVQGCRYLMPLYPFVAILAGTAVEDAPTRRLRVIAFALIVLVTTVNAAGTIKQLRPDRLYEHAQAPATSSLWHARMIVRRFGSDGPTMLNIVRRIDSKRTDPERAQLVEWIARGLAKIAATRPEDALLGGVETEPFAITLRVLAEQAPESQRHVFASRVAALGDASKSK